MYKVIAPLGLFAVGTKVNVKSIQGTWHLVAVEPDWFGQFYETSTGCSSTGQGRFRKSQFVSMMRNVIEPVKP